MSIDIQWMIDHPFVVNLASFLGRLIPTRLAAPLCNGIGDWIASHRASRVTQAVRLNQWVVRGANLEKEVLDQAVRETLRNNIRDLYSLYHFVQDIKATQRLVEWDAPSREVIERPEFAERGLIIVGLHLSGFDLILQSICRQGFKVMVITIPDPQGGRLIEYEIRKKTRMNLVPASLRTLRQAVRHLGQGGMVLTGMDHPMPSAKYHPNFFGYPAALPTHAISLALKAHVPVVIMAAIRQLDGAYHVFSSEPMEMECDSDRGEEILHNAEKVLKRAEEFIRLAPQQWNVPLPIWPELFGKMPN